MTIGRGMLSWVISGCLLALGPWACKGERNCAPGEQASCACPGGGKGAQICKDDGSSFSPCDCATAAAAAASGAPAPQTSAAAGDNDGTDARKPVLPPEDVGLVDKRGGMEWNDRCWNNIKRGKYGYAKAECDAAMTMSPASPMPLASVLYNLGLIEKAAGNVGGARSFFTKSLELRENAEVRAAMQSLPGGEQACVPCRTQEDFDGAMKQGKACCSGDRCARDADCQNGRVCCRIPNGTLCGDAARCGPGNRVDRGR